MLSVKITPAASYALGIARFYSPRGIAVDALGNLYVADTYNHCIRKITATGVVSTFAGTTGTTHGHVDGTGTEARFYYPHSLVIDSSGNLFVADTSNHCIRKVTSAGVVTTFAGTATDVSGHVDDTGTAARFNYPTGIAIDSSDNLYVGDKSNHCIRKITTGAVVTTFVGTTGATSGHVDNTGTAARFNSPKGLQISTATNVLYVADSGNHCIRAVGLSGGSTRVVTTFAGTTGTTSGHVDATGTAARFYGPSDVTFDSAGVMYVADTNNNCVRKVTTGAVVTTFAGTTDTTSGYADGQGTSALFYQLEGIVADSSNILYVADHFNDCIRKITTGAYVTTYSGTGSEGHTDSDTLPPAIILRENITEDTPIGPVKVTGVRFNGALQGGHGSASFDLIVRNALLGPPKALAAGSWVEIEDGTRLYEGQVRSIRRSISDGVHKFSVSCGGLITVARDRQDVSAGWVYPISSRWVRRPGTAEIGSITTDNSVLDIRAPVGTTEGINAAGMSSRLEAVFLLDDLLSDQEISWLDWSGTYDMTSAGGTAYALAFYTSPDGVTWTIYSAATKTAGAGSTVEAFAPPAGTRGILIQVYSNAAAHTIAADKFAHFTKFDIYSSGAVTKPTLDVPMCALASRPGLADNVVSARIGGPQDDCSVGWGTGKTTAGDGIAALAAKHATPPRWGFWDDRTFECGPEPPSPDNDARVILAESGLVSTDDGEETEDVYDYALVIYRSAATGNLTRVYRPTTPPDEGQKVKLIDLSGETHSAASAQAIGDWEVGRSGGLTGIPKDYAFFFHPDRACLGLRPGRNDDLINRETVTELSNYRATGTICGLATGGTVTLDGLYVVHSFTSSGNLVFPSGVSVDIEYLLVGGGGGGSSGGGGAGGYLAGTTTGTGTMAIVVGTGGAGKVSDGAGEATGDNGGDSTFDGKTAKGGGGGGKVTDDAAGNGASGGSGGGGGASSVFDHSGGSATGSPASQGNAGGGNVYNTTPYPAGGGGGAAAAGQNGQSASVSGDGGAGYDNDITGASVGYAGGGGGGVYNPGGTQGHATHGGGAGGVAANGTAGTANTGGGGGGAGGGFTGGAGAAGICVVRYLLSDLMKSATWSATNGYSGSGSPADPSCFVHNGFYFIDFGDLSQLDFGTGAFSIVRWFKTDAIGAAQVLFSKRAGSGTALPGLELRIETDGKLYAIASQDAGAGTYRAGKGATVCAAATWYCAIASYAGSGGDWTIYLDGVAETMTASGTAGAINTDNGSPACIGARGGIAALLTGASGPTILYDRAITAAEALSITEAGQCMYDRGTKSGTVVMQGICRDRRRAPVPARRIRAGWWLQWPDGGIVPITGHSVAPSTDTNALTIGTDWWAQELGAKQAEFLAIPQHVETLADTEAAREAEYDAQVAADAAEAAAAAADAAVSAAAALPEREIDTRRGGTGRRKKPGKLGKPRKTRGPGGQHGGTGTYDPNRRPPRKTPKKPRRR